jgi:transcriptional regulator of arginine metabolism
LSPGTATRRRRIRKLISESDITNQARIVELLAAEGFPVTQATVSRDLDALGATKVRDTAGVVHYALAANPVPLSEAELRLRRTVNEFVDEIAVSGDIVVLHTPPGAAHLVAGAIDASQMRGILGTVAGDDTLMVVAAAEPGGAAIATQIEQVGARQ